MDGFHREFGHHGVMRSSLSSRKLSASVRLRRVSAGHAESLSFAGPNESNQSKVPEHTFVKSAWLQTGAAFGSPRTSARFLADPSSRCDFIGRKSPLSHRCCSSDRLAWVARSKTLAVKRSQFEPLEIRRRNAASHPRGNGPSCAVALNLELLLKQMSGQMCIRALCFGDFHLCRQMKVTRPPGRDPATPEPRRLKKAAHA